MDSYIILNFKHIFSHYCIQGMGCILVIDVFQFSRKYIIQRMVSILLLSQIIIDSIWHTLTNLKMINELMIIRVLSFIVFFVHSRHNLGIIVQRSIQVLFYMCMIIVVIIFSLEVRDSRNFYSGMIL